MAQCGEPHYMVGSSGGYEGGGGGGNGALEAATALLLSPHEAQPSHLHFHHHLPQPHHQQRHYPHHSGVLEAKVEGSGGSGERAGVVRLAPGPQAMKLEPEQLLLQGSVIKAAPPKAHDPEPKMVGGAEHGELLHQPAIQDLQPMRPSYQDPYVSYGRHYDASAYGHLIQAPTYDLGQAIYYGNADGRADVPGYPGRPWDADTLRLAQQIPQMPQIPHSTPMALAAGLSPASLAPSSVLSWDPAAQIQYSTPSSSRPLQPLPQPLAQPPPVSSYQKPSDLAQVSPVDSGIGQEMNMTPSKEGGGEAYGGGDRQARTSSSVERTISTNRESPVRIPKLENTLGFQYTLEAPISTSVRKDDDRMTYINKGQFYCVSLDYYHDPEAVLRSGTVRTQMMVVFREEKAEDEELKSWAFWHSRQHSVKQRILDVDTNNSSGIVGKLDEIAHNAVQFCWNPMEQSVKINVAVHCLSTDFSNQKGVKGFPLHLQVDTYDDAIDSTRPFHRGYAQVKVFCDKGANRKMLHEARRDEKRRLQGRKKSDAEYHEPCDRSEFYHMSNLHKPAVLFNPPEDFERQFPAMEGFYAMPEGPEAGPSRALDVGQAPASGPLDPVDAPPLKRHKLYPSDRVLLYVRQPDEGPFTPLHVHPPTVQGLLKAVGEKFPHLPPSQVSALYKATRKGHCVKVDDAMVRLYSNEDAYVLSAQPDSAQDSFALTLQELCPSPPPASHPQPPLPPHSQPHL